MAFKLEDYLKFRDEYGDIKRKVDYCEKNKVGHIIFIIRLQRHNLAAAQARKTYKISIIFSLKKQRRLTLC
jgi:hypothetical protein